MTTNPTTIEAVSGHTPENPPAFPSPMIPEWSEGASGMTLRDWFAGQALQCMMANQRILNATEAALDPAETMPEVLARRGYALADAMLAKRTQ